MINIYDSPEEFLHSFAQVRHEDGLLHASEFCQSEVCNGGFRQFFSNSTGVLAPEAANGFAAIGQPQIAGVLQQAMALFDSPYPRQRAARQSALKLLPAGCFEELDEKFFALIDCEADGFQSAGEAYAARIQSHQSP